jgi:hypothetical protein
MARPRVEYGGTVSGYGGVAVNILNKQPRSIDKGWSSSFGIGHGANNPSPQNKNLLRKSLKSLGPGRILWIIDPIDGIRT